jgi:hypothetical protein
MKAFAHDYWKPMSIIPMLKDGLSLATVYTWVEQFMQLAPYYIGGTRLRKESLWF